MGIPPHSSQGLNAVQSMASLKRCYVSLSITTQTGSSTVGPMATVPPRALESPGAELALLCSTLSTQRLLENEGTINRIIQNYVPPWFSVLDQSILSISDS